MKYNLANYLLEENLSKAITHLGEALDLNNNKQVVSSLASKFQKTPEDIVKAIEKADVLGTPGSSKLVAKLWLEKRVEDIDGIAETLEALLAASKEDKKGAKELVDVFKSGNGKVKWDDTILDKAIAIVTAKDENLSELLKKYKVVAESGDIKVYIIKQFKESNTSTKHELFCNTNWCVKNVGMFEEYEPPYYLFVKKEEDMLALLHIPSMQLKGINDNLVKTETAEEIYPALVKILDKEKIYVVWNDLSDIVDKSSKSSVLRNLYTVSNICEDIQSNVEDGLNSDPGDFEFSVGCDKSYESDETFYVMYQEEGLVATLDIEISGHLIQYSVLNVDKNEMCFRLNHKSSGLNIPWEELPLFTFNISDLTEQCYEFGKKITNIVKEYKK